MFKAGYVAIVGRPNVGKSTLLNALVGEKVAIISPKPETTRDAILGIVTGDGHQIIFTDTPGYHLPKNLLGKMMVKRTQAAIADTDLVLLVIDARNGFLLEENRFIDFLRGSPPATTFLIINKVDLVKKELLLPLMEQASQLYPFNEIIPICARKKNYIEPLFKQIRKYLPEHPAFFPEDELTDKSERFHVQELIREQILAHTFEEIPHAIAVMVEEMRKGQGKLKKHMLYIRACIFVEKESQKKIVIGDNARMIKAIGKDVRAEIEHTHQEKVFLDLWVKVLPNWRTDVTALKRFGYLE